MKYLKPTSILVLFVLMTLGYQNCSEDISGTASNTTNPSVVVQPGVVTTTCSDEAVSGGNTSWSHRITFDVDTSEFVALKTTSISPNQNPSVQTQEWSLNLSVQEGCRNVDFSSGEVLISGEWIPFSTELNLCVINSLPVIKHLTTINGVQKDLSGQHCPQL